MNFISQTFKINKMLLKLFSKSSAFLKSQRFFTSSIVEKETKNTKIDTKKYQYVDNQLVPVNQLVLRTRQSMEEYVMKIVKDYFRTTQRATLTLDSELSKHGLDSLDLIEVAMQLETDLGYLIPSENLPVFQKPVHFVNYIEQIENFKQVYNKAPMS